MTTFTSNYDPITAAPAIFQSFNQKQSNANLHKINLESSDKARDNSVFRRRFAGRGNTETDCIRFYLIFHIATHPKERQKKMREREKTFSILT